MLEYFQQLQLFWLYYRIQHGTGGMGQYRVFFDCSFFTKFRVEVTVPVAVLAVFLGCVAGFFLSSDFTVFARVFSLLGLGLGFRSFREDSLSFIELSLVFWRGSMCGCTLGWASFYSSVTLRSVSLSSLWRVRLRAVIFSCSFFNQRYLASFSLSFSSQWRPWVTSASTWANFCENSSSARCLVSSIQSFFAVICLNCSFSFSRHSLSRYSPSILTL